jgi:uncharacterized protein (TIGR02271 family)
LFDNRAEAEAARTRLTQSRIDVDRVQIIDKSQSAASSGESGSSEGEGFWASLKTAFMPEEDGHAYEEGMRRGGYLLCAQVDEDQADEAIRILDEGGSVDFDQRQEQWKSEGWSGFTAGGQSTGTTGGSLAAAASSDMTNGRRSNTVEEQHIPIVEEELRVGKREVSRGGARVRSYVREIPVHEQVTLREEHVSVERRPVDQTIAAADLNSGDLLRDRTIEMTETAEEAVVAKEARVREEVVVKKTAEQHVEQIDDTVRRTEVEVDEGQSGAQDRSAFGFKEGGTGTASSGSGTGTTGGTGATGFETQREPEPQGSGYSERIDKTGL